MVRRFLIQALLVGVMLPVAASAQSFVSFSGTLGDQSGAMLPGATLSLANSQSGARYEVRSGASGAFEFVGLPAGQFTLEVKLPGFQSLKETITIAGRPVSRALTLHLGELEETLHITAERGGAPQAQRPADPASTGRARIAFQEMVARCSVAVPDGGIRIGGSIRPPLKIRNVSPQYPANLAETGTGGIVRLVAVIGPDGYVREVTNADTSAPPDLVNASVAAVREWEFTGTLLNCVPVEVTMHVLLSFEAR